MPTTNWDRSLSRSLDETLDQSSATTAREAEWDGGRQRKQSIPGGTTLPSSNPYKRRALLPRRSTEMGKRVDTFNTFHEETSVLSTFDSPVLSYGNWDRTVVGVHDGNNPGTDACTPLGSSRRGSQSPSSSRSVSPNIHPWYPPGRRPSPDRHLHIGKGDGDEPTRKKVAENAYILHPAHRHMFEMSERDNEDGWAAGESAGGRDVIRAAPLKSMNDRTPRNRGNKLPTRDLRKVAGRRHSHERKKSSSPRKSKDDTMTDDPSTPKNDRHIRFHEGEKGRYITSRGGGAWDEHGREDVAAIRHRVRSLQDVGEGRKIEKPPACGHHETRPTREALTKSGSQSSAVFTGHEGQILALARHESILFSASADATAKAWNIRSQRCLATYEGHRRAVWSMQVTGQTLITGSADGTVRFWDIETARSLHIIDLRLPVRDILVLGNVLAAATSSVGIEMIDLNSMERRDTLQGHLLAVSALASLDGGKRLVSGSHDTFIRIWNPTNGMCDAVLGGHSGTIGALFVRCTGSSATGDPGRKEEASIVSGSGDATVRVWGRTCEDSGETWGCVAVLEGHRHGVWAANGSPATGIIATGGGDATVKVWAPTSSSSFARVAEARAVRDDKRLVDERGTSPGWECVGGVRGTIGAVGAVLITEDALLFGTSEALIARFPLQSCMPAS